ncbi:MAG: TlpA disulfide reductase family protein [Isosphaeraceae bacterium]|nr:TlpA disulfide reductase family protein [Isosphaeraceae bacterium]
MDSPTDSRRKDDRIWLYVGVAFAIFWGLYLAVFNPSAPREGPSLAAPAPSLPADYDWAPTDLDGNPVIFRKFQGKPVFLNIWATWCGPCLSEMPSIAKLSADPRLRGKVEFVCVSIDSRPGIVKSFVADRDWSMTMLHTEDLPNVFLTEGIPATFILSPDGKIVAREVGSAVWDGPEVVDFLERLAASK